jgi:ferredoxin-NADP reductase
MASRAKFARLAIEGYQEVTEEVAWPADHHPLTYICGPTPLVEAVASSLVTLGHEP